MSDLPNAAADTYDFEFAALSEAVNYRRALVSEFSQVLHGNVVEIGCGIGQMTSHLRSLSGVSRLLSVEPEPAYCEKHRNAFLGHELLQGTVDMVPTASWNSIVCINVLEHIEDDEGELKKYRDLLACTSGVLCLLVPARPEIYAPIDCDFGHFRRYTRENLRAKLVAAGFHIARLDYFNSLGYLAWWFNFCLLKHRTFETRKVRFYDRAVFPLVHFAETRISRPPVGQSLIAVARA